jgi:DNA-directed RNA polymerase subunit RPC12/RpoP
MGKSSHLCQTCFETSAPPEIRQSEAEGHDARCQYCGGRPFTGGTDFFALMSGVQQMKYMCMPCSFEHNQYTQQELTLISPNLSQQEQLAAIRTLNMAVDKHMQEWVSKRDSR